MRRIFLVSLSSLLLLSCSVKQNGANSEELPPPIYRVGEMKDVMWKGELGAKIKLDSISTKAGLYGLGPLSYLQGEILINDGRAYASKVLTDSSMSVEESFAISAPFFVYSYVSEWEEMRLPSMISDIKKLEAYIAQARSETTPPFAFKLIGSVSSATIHIQNLAEGTVVSSPQEAHQGQQNYELGREEVEIVGFFSRTDQGVFTHHDSFLHMHLITKDGRKMGHLDRVEFENMKLYLPPNG